MAKTETIQRVLYGGRVVIDFYPNSHRYKLISVDGVPQGRWLKSPTSIINKLDKSGPLVHWAVRCFHERVVEEMRDGVNFTRDDVMTMLALGQNAHTEKKQAAADVGTVVHDYAQHFTSLSSVEKAEGFEQLTDEDKGRALRGAEGLKSWYASLNGKVVESEFLVFSIEDEFTGTCDGLVQLANGEYIIIDFKTSKGVYSSQIYQVSAYWKAKMEERPDMKIAGARLVHLFKEDVTDKDGNVVRRAGEFGEVFVTAEQLETAYKAFSALKVVAEIDPEITKLLVHNG